jgi:signal transduction histidine kinase
MSVPTVVSDPLGHPNPRLARRDDTVAPDERDTGHTDVMLRTATWVVRVAAIVAVGVGTFADSSASGRTLTAQIVAYALGGVVLAAWWARTHWQGTRQSQARQLPILLAILAACSAGCSSTNGSGLIAFGVIATLGAGSDTSLVAGWTVAGVGALAIEVGALVSGASTSAMLGYPLLLVVALLAGHNRRSYRVQAEQAAVMLEQVEQLRAEQRQVAVLDERNRIAREIHDVLAHSLGALSIQIQASRALLSDQRDVDRSLGALDKAQRMVTDGLVETRRAVLALRSGTQPLTDELALLVDSHRSRHHVPIAFDVDGETRALPPEAELALLRTAQESLVNAAKHSAGQPITVRLDYGKEQVSLTITNALEGKGDNGSVLRTIDGGYGLLGMRERLLLLDGSLTAEPDGRRWIVAAQVPQ